MNLRKKIRKPVEKVALEIDVDSLWGTFWEKYKTEKDETSYTILLELRQAKIDMGEKDVPIIPDPRIMKGVCN